MRSETLGVDFMGHIRITCFPRHSIGRSDMAKYMSVLLTIYLTYLAKLSYPNKANFGLDYVALLYSCMWAHVATKAMSG